MHRLLALGTGLLVIATCLLAVGAWRLAQRPIDLGVWSDRVRAALADDDAPVHVSFDGMVLAWEGFHEGADNPLDLRLSNITMSDRRGHRLFAAPSVHLTFSLAGLVLGRVVPRDIEVDHARIAATREADGAISLGWTADAGVPDADMSNWGMPNSGMPNSGMGDTDGVDIRQLREQLSRPASSDHGRSRGLLDQLQRVHFRNAEVALRDRPSGLVLRTTDMDVDLVRARAGHVHGRLRAPLTVGGQPAGLTGDADWTSSSGLGLDVKLTSLRPAGIGALPAAVAFMAGIDVPVSIAASIGFDTSFKPSRITADVKVGQGQIQIAQGSVPVRSGSIALSGTPGEIVIQTAHFDLAHAPDGRPETLDIGGTVTHAADRLSAALTLGLSQIDIADLPRLWPPGVGGGARPWVTEHVTAGMVTHAAASMVIEADDGLRDVVLTKATGDLDGSNGTFTWIDHIPPVEQTDFHLHLVDPDTLDIRVSSAHQRIRNGGADLVIRDGQMRITGLSLRDQIAVIRTQVEGSVASALALLKEPRLHLLSDHPIALRTGAGDAAVTLDFQFPLENKLQIDDVRVHADAHLTNVQLPDIADGQSLEDGEFDLGIDKDGLSLKGQGSVAAVPVTLNGMMDFTPGPADQVVQKIAMSGQADAAKLEAAGLHVADFLGGPVPLTVVLIERRGGNGSVAISGDLTLATLAVDPLAWSKSSGSIATASATLMLSHDRLTRVDRIAVRGDGLLLNGSADFADGHIRTISLDTIRLGRTQGHGTVHLGPNQPIAVVLQGEQIDLSPKLSEKTSGAGSDAPPVTTPAWTLDARFDHALLANAERASDVLVKATGGGQSIVLLDAVGTSNAGAGQPNAGFSIRIEPRSGARHLSVEAKDAGSFLRGMDAVRGMRSGHLLIDGVFERPSGFQPLAGTATIDDVVVRNSPFLGKLLQAITLYGLVDVLRGPGMSFSHIVVPFHYGGGELSVDEAHGFNSSLGLTANGRIGVSSGQASLTGTIVPAYFFNAMLGNLPLVGRLFSPEKGGGVFAARFAVDGPIDDPDISINPVSALTPGFLRGIFGVFDQAPAVKDGTAAARK